MDTGRFRVSALVSKAGMGVEVEVSAQASARVPFVYVFRREIARWESSSIYDFYSILHAAFHSGYSHSQSHSQGTRGSLSPHPCQPLLSLVFLMMDILTGVRYCLIVVVICRSLMTCDIECLFMSLLTFYTSSLERCLFRCFANFLVGLFGFSFGWVIWVLYISGLLSSLSDTWFASLFSHPIGFIFTLLMVSVALQELVHVM